MGIKNNNTIKKTADDNSSAEVAQNASNAQSFRTLQSDMVSAVKTQDRSLAQMIIADKKRRRESGYGDKKVLIENNRSKNILKLFLGVGIILLIVTIVTFGIKSAWQEKERAENPPREQVSAAIIPVNRQIVLNTKTFTDNETFITTTDNALAKNKIKDREILHLLFVKEIEITDQETNEVKKTEITLPVNEFFKLWENNAPESLIRSFEKENYMFGFYNTGEKTEPFLLFKSKNFDQTYAGILEWENILCKDTQNIFLTEKEYPQYKFKNAQLLGMDIRVLENELGKPVILHGFLDNEKMFIITESTVVFKEIRSLFD